MEPERTTHAKCNVKKENRYFANRSLDGQEDDFEQTIRKFHLILIFYIIFGNVILLKYNLSNY